MSAWAFSAGAPGYGRGPDARLHECVFEPEPRPRIQGYPAYWGNCLARYARVGELLREKKGTHDVASLAQILGDVRGHSSTERLFGDTVLMPVNVGAVVFDPELRRVYVAEGPAPVAHSRFVPVDLVGDDVHARVELAFRPKGFADARLREAYPRYLEIVRLAFERQDYGAAYQKACELTERLPTQPELWHLRGC